jgi:hypothetical protein
MNQDEKKVLLALVAEIERSRAMLDLLAARAGTGVSLAVAGEAMKAALQDNSAAYNALRKQIEELA